MTSSDIYQRSIKPNAMKPEDRGIPDPFGFRQRENLNIAIRAIVAEGEGLEFALQTVTVIPEETGQFRKLLLDELRILNTHNCARYRLSIRLTEQWVHQGRPTSG